MDNFELLYTNSSGATVILSSPSINRYWVMNGRSGFSAPDVELITQKYANNVEKILGRILKPRTVKINMVVVASSRAKRDYIFFDMIAKLMDNTNGEMGKLEIKRSDGRTVFLNCAYSSGLNAVDEYKNLQKFTLEFYAADPYFYHDEEEAVLQSESQTRLTLSNSHVFGTHRIGEIDSSGRGVIENNSTETVQPVISMNKILGSITLVNNTTRKKIALSGMNIYGGTMLVIDTRDSSKDIYILQTDGTKTPAGQYLDWENLNLDFPIVSGKNEIDYFAGEGSAINKIIFRMSEKYLSA